MTTTFVILGVTIVLFVWGRWPADLVALLSLLALALTGVIGASDAVAGFGNPTVVMIAALFVVGEGLSRTGVTGWGGKLLLETARGSNVRLLVVVMAGTAGLSAFISNTGTVATLLPAIVAAAWAVGSVPSKYLMPLAFAANTGGLLTLTGTPPNIVVAQTLEQAGLRPFSFFEYALIGGPLLVDHGYRLHEVCRPAGFCRPGPRTSARSIRRCRPGGPRRSVFAGREPVPPAHTSPIRASSGKR